MPDPFDEMSQEMTNLDILSSLVSRLTSRYNGMTKIYEENGVEVIDQRIIFDSEAGQIISSFMPAGAKFPEHIHNPDSIQLVYVIQGYLLIELANGNNLRLRTGEAAIIEHIKHKVSARTNTEYICAIIPRGEGVG